MINGDSNLREFGKFRLDPKKRVLWFENEPVNLPLKEIELLCVLTEQSGQVLTKDEILDRVWGDSFVEESNLSRHIYLLRKTLKEHGESEDLIQTVPRRGYRFTGQVLEAENEAIVVERRTSTTTRIEIEESEPAVLALPARTSRKFVIIGSTALAALAFAAVIGVVYWSRQAVVANAEIKSIAVLPVRSFAQGGEDEELRMRITDALITRLGGLSRIAVRPTSAVLPFAGSPVDAVELGKKLRVDAVIDSYVQREADRLRVTVQVLRVADGDHLWSEQFDGQADQILSLQDSISTKVSRSLNEAVDGTAFAKRPTEKPDAYEAYLKGRFFWTKRDEASLRKAIEYFTQAGTLDPQFSEAFSGLADAQHLLFNYNIDVRPEVVAEAKENLRRALELKPDSADALTTLGTIQMGYDWDWPAAEESLKRAVAAAPNSSVARMRYGALLVRIRRFDEARQEFEKAIELDPLSVTANTNLGLTLFCKQDYPAADRQYEKALELDEKVGGTRWLRSRSFWQQGRKDEAIREIAAALELDRNPELGEKVRQASASAPEDAIKVLLHEWRDNPPGTNPHNLAYLSTYVSDGEKALHWMEKSFDEHHPWSTWFAAAPEFEVLRGDSRYQEIIQKMKLP